MKKRFYVTVRRRDVGELHGFVDGANNLDALIQILGHMGWIVTSTMTDRHEYND